MRAIWGISAAGTIVAISAVTIIAFANPVGAPTPLPPLDFTSFDHSSNRCQDFYQHVCGGWLKQLSPRLSQPMTAMASEAATMRNRNVLAQILEGNDQPSSPAVTRLRTFFGSCIKQDDIAAELAERRLQSLLQLTANFNTSREFVEAFLLSQRYGAHTLIRYSGEPDVTRRTRFRGEIHQGDLGQSRATYLGDVSRLSKYQNHIERMFVLSGTAATQASSDAKAVIDIETALAKSSLTFSQRFEPAVSNNPTSLDSLSTTYPAIPWREYLELVGHQAENGLNITSPDYLKAVNVLLTETPISALRAFMRWRIIDATNSALSSRFQQERQRFILETSGTAPRSRHDTCLLETVKGLGVELSREYSVRAIGNEARDLAKLDVELVRAHLVKSVDSFTWLSAEARRNTKAKLSLLDLKIGFPDEWPPVGTYQLRSNDYFSNLLESKAYEEARGWKRAKEPRSRLSWEITVYPNAAPGLAVARLTIPNGFPDVFTNSIILTAAYLQPPQFDSSASIELRLGGFGAMIGHELVHVLENHEFDELGEAREIWTPEDAKAHSERTMCLVRQADNYVLPDGSRLNGRNTVAENAADLSGLALSYAALKERLGGKLSERDARGYTRAQRFFIAYAQSNCAVQTDEFARVDSHGPPKFRVNAILANLPEFNEAFSCANRTASRIPTIGQCKVW